MNWNFELAKLEFGLIHMDEVPELAGRALAEGIDSKSLRILGGLEKSDSLEISEYLKKTLRELGVESPARKEAARQLILFYIDQIINQQIKIQEGLRNIVREVYGKMEQETKDERLAGESIGIHELIASYWEIDDLCEIVIDWNDLCPWDESKTNRQMLDELCQEAIEAAKKCRQRLLTSEF
jgi:hypothetical protein